MLILICNREARVAARLAADFASKEAGWQIDSVVLRANEDDRWVYAVFRGGVPWGRLYMVIAVQKETGRISEVDPAESSAEQYRITPADCAAWAPPNYREELKRAHERLRR